MLIYFIMCGGSLLLFLFLFSVWFESLGRVSFVSQREKGSAFECGFESKDTSRVPFSLRFFFLLLLFLVFDIELTLLLQLPSCIGSFFWKTLSAYSVFFFIIFGFIVEEIRQGLLVWGK